VDDNQGPLPPHISASRWPDKFYDYYGKKLALLKCPSEVTNTPATLSPSNNVAYASPRSYFINGFNDYFESTLSSSDWSLFLTGQQAVGIKESSIIHPSGAIVLGEKISSRGDFYMDMKAGNGDDFSGAVAQDRHSGRGEGSGTGGSNATLDDGSTRYFKYGAEFDPLNLWAVSDADRAAYMIQF
jgi:hypothetical protein